jgi:hypothetical protein
MTALGAKFGVNRDGMLAVRTVHTRRFLFLFGLRQTPCKILGKHGRHH